MLIGGIAYYQLRLLLSVNLYQLQTCSLPHLSASAAGQLDQPQPLATHRLALGSWGVSPCHWVAVSPLGCRPQASFEQGKE